MKRTKRILIFMLMAVFIISNFIQSGTLVKGATTETIDMDKIGIRLTDRVGDIIGTPGETVHVTLPVRAIGGTIYDPRITVVTTNMPFTVDNITYKDMDVATEVKPSWISNVSRTNIEFDIKIKETAKITNAALIVKIDGTIHTMQSTEESISLQVPNLNFIIKGEKEPAQLTVDGVVFNNAVIGSNRKLSFVIKNEGQISAINTYYSITPADFTAAGIAPKYSKLKQKIGADGKLGSGEFQEVSLPLSVLPTATAGSKALTINFEYKNDDGTVITSTCPIYVEVKAKSKTPKIEIDSTKHASELKPGDTFTLVATLSNVGTATATNIEVALDKLGADGFIPNYTLDKIEAGELDYNSKTDVKIPLIVSDDATKGLKEIPVTITYKDNDQVAYTTSTKLYLEVVKDDDAISKPKLIISKFSTSSDQLRAGSTFDFKFDIKNTHTRTTAKNIKVTVSQADNIFMVAEGSNSFYLTKILPGQTVENVLKMKVKNDAVTKTYPVDITMEYEYDGEVANPTTGEIGETIKQTITLQAVENARAVVNNVVVGSYGAPVINQPTALTFEFYNMGKSTLSNVTASVEGDFTLSTGTMYFMGNFEAGGSDYPELEVIPNVEGQAKGTLTVTFEDSNGDPVKVSKEFEASVQGEMLPDMGQETMGDNIGGPTVPGKKAILPMWAFILVQVGILFIVTSITRKIVLGRYRKKLRKQEDAQ